MKVATRRHSNFEHQKPSVTLWPKFHEVSAFPSLMESHIESQQLRTGTCRCHCKRFRPHIVMLPGYGFMDGPEDQMRPRPAVCLLRWCWFFWGGWLVRLFQWDFHRLVFGVVYMHDIYIYMEDCAFTCSCLDCHPDILNEAFKKILKIQNGKRAFGPAWRKKKGISIQFTFRNDWRFQIAVTLNSPRGIEFFSRELSSRRWIFKEIPVPNCPKNS